MPNDDIVGLFSRKPSRGSGIEGMESVVATVSGYHGTERFNFIKLISQTGANYVGNMSKSVTHLVCWRFEGMKYSLARKFKTLIVSHKWFEDCAKSGKRLPEDAYLMKCGKEVGPIQFEGLLMEKENLQTRAHSNILADETNMRGSSEKLKNILQDGYARKKAPSLSRSVEQSSYSPYMKPVTEGFISKSRQVNDTSPVISRRFGCAALEKRNSKGSSSSSKNHSKVLQLSALVVDKGLESSSSDSQYSHRRKRDTNHNTSSKIIADTSSKGRKLVKKNATRTFLESGISDSDEDCYVLGTSLLELVGDEEHVDLSIDVSPQKTNLPNDSVVNYQENPNEDTVKTNQSNQPARQPISSEPSCAICWTDFSLSRGILPCGHRYCYPCIQNWSDQLVSKGKVSTCPLCKENFHSILKVDDAGASDQKVYSQTIPCAPLMRNVSFLPDHGLSGNRTQILTSQVCSVCYSREPEELLVSCNVCQIRCIHAYCLDPPLFPWVCVHCGDLRNVFQRG